MSEPIVIIDTSSIRQGKLEDLRSAMSELARFVETHEPRAIAYNVYVDSAGSKVTVFQVHPDSSSAEFHMEVAGPAFGRFADLLELDGIDVYGRPSQRLLSRLQRKAEMLGGKGVAVHEPHAGFARFQPVTSSSLT